MGGASSSGKAHKAAAGADEEENDEALSEEDDEEDEALPGDESAMDADEEGDDGVGAYQEAASMLERDLLSKLADLLALRFDVVDLVKEPPAANVDANARNEVATTIASALSTEAEGSSSEEKKGSTLGAWALQISNAPARMPPPPPSTTSALAALQSAADKASPGAGGGARAAGAATLAAAAAAATAVAALAAAGSPTCFVRWAAGSGLQVEAAPVPPQLQVLASAHAAAAAATAAATPAAVGSAHSGLAASSSSSTSSSSSSTSEAGVSSSAESPAAADPPGVVALNGWVAKGQALAASVEHALAHALAAAGPVRTDAAW